MLSLNLSTVSYCELTSMSGYITQLSQEDASTPVHLACALGHIEMVQMMFDRQPDSKGACLQARDEQGMTPLHMATLYDHVDIANYLLDEVRAQ